MKQVHLRSKLQNKLQRKKLKNYDKMSYLFNNSKLNMTENRGKFKRLQRKQWKKKEFRNN